MSVVKMRRDTGDGTYDNLASYFSDGEVKDSILFSKLATTDKAAAMAQFKAKAGGHEGFVVYSVKYEPELGVREREEFFEGVWSCVLFTGGVYSDNPTAPSRWCKGNLPKPEDKLRPEDLEALKSDCDQFLAMPGVVEAIRTWDGHDRAFEKAGNDFHYDRNGHGCGFWDGDWKEPGATLLSEAADSFGSFELDRGEQGETAEEDEDGFFDVNH